jgi:eukaryotic-like serine/threonine-protein kinase
MATSENRPMEDPKPKLPNASSQDVPPPGDDNETISLGISPSRLKAAFLPDNTLASRFKVVRFIARGGMGEVYEAQDLELNERVALKTVRFEMLNRGKFVERFKREIQFARRVTHPNVCRTFDVFRHTETQDGETRETLFVSMELLSGETLAHRILRQGRLSTEEALPIVEQMAAGLQAAHEAGIIHRDFKCPNVMLLASPNSPGGLRAVITDFGIARGVASSGEALTRSLDVVGTPAYMAPEQLESGEITPVTDIYALGIVIYEMLTGQRPFSGESALSTALMRLNNPAPSPRLILPDIEPRWEKVVMRCLERIPENRFASAADVSNALKGEKFARPKQNFAALFRQRRLVFAGLLIALLAAAGYLGFKNHLWTTKPTANAPATAQPAKRTAVAVLGFRDLSSDKQQKLIGEMLADGLWSQLDTDEIRFIAPSAVDEMKRNLGLHDVSASPGKDQLAKIGDYLGCDVLIVGSYREDAVSRPAKVDWNVHLIRMRDNESLGSLQLTGDESELNTMVSRAGRLVRSKLGVELQPVEAARLDASLSSNAEALKNFSEARGKIRNFDIRGATILLQKAIVADSEFAQAHSLLSEAWAELGFETKAQQEAKTALDLSTKLSADARGLIKARYYETTRDWDNAIQQYASLWTLYPDDPEYGLLLAKAQIAGGKSQAALTTLEQVRRKTLPVGLAARVHLAAADAQDALANHREQLAAATSAATEAESLNASLLLARARIQQCWALLNLGKPEEAKPRCEEARKLNQEMGDQLGTARATNDVANAYWQQGEGAIARPLYEQALSLAQSIGDKVDEAGALNNLANIMDDQGDLDGARKAYLQSIAVSQERGDKNEMVVAQQNLAALYYRQGDRKSGKEMFSKAIAIARDIGEKKTEARALNNLCMFLLQAGEVQQALKSCQDSLKLRTEMEDHGDTARSLVNTADVLLAQGNLDSAKKNYLDGLKTQEELGQKDYAAYTRISLSILCSQEGSFLEARSYAEQAATELAAEKDSDGEGQARGALAEVLFGLRDTAGAQRQIHLARDLAAKAKDQYLKLSVTITQARIDAASGNTDAAVSALRGVQQEARKAGLVAVELQARLALGNIQVRAGRTQEGRAALAAVAVDARAKGFGLVAKKARTN